MHVSNSYTDIKASVTVWGGGGGKHVPVLILKKL